MGGNSMSFNPDKSKFLGVKWKKDPITNKRIMATQVTCKNCNCKFFYGIEEGSKLPTILFCPMCNRLARGNFRDLISGD